MLGFLNAKERTFEEFLALGYVSLQLTLCYRESD